MTYKDLSTEIKKIVKSHNILNGQYIYTGLIFIVLNNTRVALTTFDNIERVNIRLNRLLNSLGISERTWANLKKYAQKFGFITLVESHCDLKLYLTQEAKKTGKKYSFDKKDLICKWGSPDFFNINNDKINEFISKYTNSSLDPIISKLIENYYTYDKDILPNYKWLNNHLILAYKLSTYSRDSRIAYNHFKEYQSFLNTPIKYEGKISKELEKVRKRIIKNQKLQYFINTIPIEYAPIICRWVEAISLLNKEYQDLNTIIEYSNNLRDFLGLLNQWNESRTSIKANIKETKNGFKVRNGGRTTTPLCNSSKGSILREKLNNYTAFDLHSGIQTTSKIWNKKEFDPDWSFKDLLAKELNKNPYDIKNSAICYRLSYGTIGAQYKIEKERNYKNYSLNQLQKSRDLYNKYIGKTNSRLINIRESIFEMLFTIYEMKKGLNIENIYDEFFIKNYSINKIKKDLKDFFNLFITYLDDQDSLQYLLNIL